MHQQIAGVPNAMGSWTVFAFMSAHMPPEVSARRGTMLYVTSWPPERIVPASRPKSRRLAFCSHSGPMKHVLPSADSLSGTAAALDLAATAPPQQSLAPAGQHALAAASQYAVVKGTCLHTAQVCAEQGVRFATFVVESTGAWEPSASKTLQLLSPAVAARTRCDAGLLHADLLQELSVLRGSHHACAALRRWAALL